MKRIIALIVCVVFCVCALTGCFGASKIKDLPGDAVQIETAEIEGYCGVSWNGREYMPYGTQNGTIYEKYIDRCVGWTGDDTNSRVYTLSGTDDYIAEYYVGGEMEQFRFLRALDTVGEDIDTPEYIASLDYELWTGIPQE